MYCKNINSRFCVWRTKWNDSLTDLIICSDFDKELIRLEQVFAIKVNYRKVDFGSLIYIGISCNIIRMKLSHMPCFTSFISVVLKQTLVFVLIINSKVMNNMIIMKIWVPSRIINEIDNWLKLRLELVDD